MMNDKSYCCTFCDQQNCERNLRFHKPITRYYSVATFDNSNPDVSHKDCEWKINEDDFKKDNLDILRDELSKLNDKVNEANQLLATSIPRRRVRRIYKMLGNILEADTDVKPYVETLKNFINKIEKEGEAVANNEIKTAIEHLLSVRER